MASTIPATAPTMRKDRFTRHRGPVTSVVLIPNSHVAVTSAYDGAVATFDLQSGEVRLLGYHRHLVNRIVVNETGTKAASCSSDYTTCIWDLASGRAECVLKGHSDDVEDFAFIDDDTGVSASRDQRLLVWDLPTGAIKQVLEGHDKDVLSVAYHAGRIYSAGDDMTLRVWDLDTGALLTTWGPFETETDACAIDPIHGRAVLGCDDGYVRVFDTERGSLAHEIEAHSSGIKNVVVSPATGDILSAAYDQRLIVWDAETMQEKLALEKVQSTWERSLTWSPDGRRILGGTFDGTVLVWDAVTGKLEHEFGDQQQEPGNACLNDVGASDQGDIALVSDDGFVRIGKLTATQSELLATTAPASGRILMNAVTLDAKNDRVVAGTHNHRLHIFEQQNGCLENGIEVHLGEGPINSVRIAHHAGYEGDAFVGCYSSAIVRVSASGKVMDKIHVHEGAVKSLCLHPHKTFGVSCGADGLLQSWTFPGERMERYLGHTAIINDVDLNPAGDRLASVSRDFSVKVFDVFSGKLLHSIAIGNRSLKSVCFWDAGTIVIGDYWDTLIKVDLSSGRLERKKVAQNGISALHRSGNFLVAVSYDGTAYLVKPESLQVVNTLRVMRQRLDER